MKLVSYESGQGARAGVLTDGGLIDAWRILGGEGEVGLRVLIADERLGELADAVAAGDGASVSPGPTLLPPIPDPEKIVCIGLNYAAHAAEAGIEPPSSPTIFGKYRNALVGDGATVTLPAASTKVDFEAEVAVVIGRRASGIEESEALDHIAGYSLFNDLSARDLQFATPQWMAGKVFDGSAPFGPHLTTPDEAGPPDGIGIALDLNGERMQEATTADLIFPIPALVAELSKLMTLEPGDVIATGTPSGVGSTRSPRVWLKPGDELVVSSPTLGELGTTIA